MNKNKIFKILLLEDNLADIRLIEEVLKETSYPVNLNVITDGENALTYLKEMQSHPHLILLDLNLPKQNGFTILKELKNKPSLKRIPVIILTISQSEDDILKCYELHANCYITKPFQLEEFISTFKAIINFWFGIVSFPSNEE